MRPGVVRDPASDPGEPTEFHLKFAGKITSMDDVPSHADLRSNAELALARGDILERWTFEEWKGGRRRRKRAADLLWWPRQKRAGIVYWPKAREDEYYAENAKWTDAANPPDALSRWVYGEMTD